MIDPNKSCDPDDRELMSSAVRKRPRMSIERADSYTSILLKRMESALSQNHTLEMIRVGEMELDVQHVQGLQKAIETSSSSMHSSSSSSSSSSSGKKRKRRVVDKTSVETTQRW